MSAADDAGRPGCGELHQHEFGSCRWWHGPQLSDEVRAMLQREAGASPAVLDALQAMPNRPQLVRVEGWRIWTLTPVAFEPSTVQVVVGELVVATDGSEVITFGRLPMPVGEDLCRNVVDRQSVPLRGAAMVVEAVFAELLETAGRVAAALDDAVEDIEAAVFDPQRGSHAERIYRLKREVQRTRRCVGPLPELMDIDWPATSADATKAADGVGSVELVTHARRVAELVAHADDLLDSVLAAHHTRVTIQQNDDMRRISAWVAIVAAPTAIASVYGMNFRYMPELSSPLGYPVVLLAMLGICITLYRLFRRSGWL